MEIKKANNLSCPLCGLLLQLSEKQHVCLNGHSFDIARQGYVNLLPVQQKRSKNPGDSKEMIVARTEFLNTGLYQPIAERFNELCHELTVGHKDESEGVCLVDAGCGEGYYLQSLLSHLERAGTEREVSFIGLDISKPAILAASKRSKKISWLVSSNKQLPVLPGTVDIIICMFGFPVYESFKESLKPGGKLILVDAGQDHLLELRNIIYPSVNMSDASDLAGAEKSGFDMYSDSRLTYAVNNVPNEQLMNLLHMTPHFFRASQEGKQAVSQLQSIDLTVDVVFRVLHASHPC
ncbi:MAG: methyltransferase domain-containing protein [Gammaproteobacteria bacterium]|nr:methyltransferase domain-containing protein [Gammaproteobacteria bacterium]